MKETYEMIYSYCNQNRKILSEYKDCICLYCGQQFDYEKITEWINDGSDKTALCPYCHIDAVIPTKIDNGIDKYNMTKDIQEKIKKIYF